MIPCVSPGRSGAANLSAQPLGFISAFWIRFPFGTVFVSLGANPVFRVSR